MVTDESPLDELFGVLALKVKRLLQRARKRLWGRAVGQKAPRRRKKRSASSKAAAALARKRWTAEKKAQAAHEAKLAERRAKRAAAKAPNVIPFRRRVG